MGITDFRSTRTVKYRESVYVPPLPVPVTRKSVDYTRSPKAYQQARPRASTTQADYPRNEQEPIGEEKEDDTAASASSSQIVAREEMVTEESFTSALRRGSSASAASSALATPKSDHGHWPGSSASVRICISVLRPHTPMLTARLVQTCPCTLTPLRLPTTSPLCPRSPPNMRTKSPTSTPSRPCSVGRAKWQVGPTPARSALRRSQWGGIGQRGFCRRTCWATKTTFTCRRSKRVTRITSGVTMVVGGREGV